MRSRFLNEFGFLYTEKRVSYEELFEMYKSCRRRNVPEYRWKQEVLGRMAGRMGEGHTM
jgi:N-acetylglutamate synthase-like GNAT family acetyltransferase